jgi:hypothetical protein
MEAVMFGIFRNALDTRKTTDDSLDYLNSLDPKTKAVVVLGMEKFLNYVYVEKLTSKEAFQHAMEAKRHVRVTLKLQSSSHPEFAKLQLLEDAYMSLHGHAKLKSGKYSANKFFDFMVANGADDEKTAMLLSLGGFDPLNLF